MKRGTFFSLSAGFRTDFSRCGHLTAAGFDGAYFFGNIAYGQDVTALLVEVKQRVEMLQTVTADLRKRQEADREEADLDLPWRMTLFLEAHVLGLSDPSGEMRVLVQAVKEQFEDCKRLTKEMERSNHRLRRERETESEGGSVVRPALRKGRSSGDPKSHFAQMEDERIQKTREQFEKQRRNSLARKAGAPNAHPLSQSGSIKRTAPAVEHTFVPASSSAAGDLQMPQRPLSGLKGSASLSDLDLRDKVAKGRQIAAGKSAMGSSAEEVPLVELSRPTLKAVRSSVESLSSPTLAAPSTALGASSRGTRSSARAAAIDLAGKPSFRVGSHRNQAQAAEDRSPALNALLSPQASPPSSPVVSPGNRSPVEASPRGGVPQKSPRNASVVAFEFEPEQIEEIRKVLQSEAALFLEQCRIDAKFGYVVGVQSTRAQIGWASRMGREEIAFYNREGEECWRGVFVPVVVSEDWDAERGLTRMYMWREENEEAQEEHLAPTDPRYNVMPARVVTSVPPRKKLPTLPVEGPAEPASLPPVLTRTSSSTVAKALRNSE